MARFWEVTGSSDATDSKMNNAQLGSNAKGAAGSMPMAARSGNLEVENNHVLCTLELVPVFFAHMKASRSR